MSSFKSRLQRIVSLLRQTQRDHGAWATSVLFVSLARRKLPLPGARPAQGLLTALVRRRLRADLPRPTDIHVAVAATGGIGDLLVIARFMRDLQHQVGALRFDVFSAHPETAAWVFGQIEGFGRSFNDLLFEPLRGAFDAALRIDQFVVVLDDRARWPALRRVPAMMDIITTLLQHRPAIETLVRQHPSMDNVLGRTAVSGGHTRRTYLHHLAGLPYGGDRFALAASPAALARAGLQPGGYVTVHNGFDTGFIITRHRATKCYPHFDAVIAQLRQARPDLHFVQLGASTSEPLAQCDVNLIGQTTLAEVAGLLAHAVLHLDNESGLVHMASVLGTTAAVVFGPTPSDYFHYPDNIAIDPPVCGGCWWMTPTWMDTCAKGYGEARCMTEQKPEAVVAAVLPRLSPAGP